MERKTFLKVVLVGMLVVSFILPVHASAQPQRPRRGGLYGDWQIKMKFGDQEFETSFEGKIAESKLNGELKTSRGTSKVTGARRTFRRRSSGQR